MSFWDKKTSLQWSKKFGMIATLLSISHRPLNAAALDWSGESFFIMTKGMKVAKILEDLGANYGVPVIVSQKIDEIFVGTLQNKDPEEILQNFSSLYHLIWYFDGRTLYVCKASEISQVVIMPNYLTLEMLEEYLSKTDVLDPRSWSVKKVPGFNAFEIMGPPAFVSRIEKLVSELDDHALNLEQNKEVVEIIPLKYAQAEDQIYQYQGNNVVLPGVVSLLEQMKNNTSNQANVQGQFTQGSVLPIISADRRKNAVVIRDLALNLDLYRKLIDDLDQVQQQVEISVTIIDMDVNNTKDLGLNFYSEIDAKLVSGALGVHCAPLTNNAQPSIDNGFGFSSKIKDCLEFTARIKALQTQSRAQIVAQPSIITLNNTKAILDKSVTFYTKVGCSEESKLETITSGTLLEVTPCLSLEKITPQIQLQIHLKDGKLDHPSSASGLPQVQDSEIMTQAILNSGEGLLLGGFVREENRNCKQSIPWIGDLPFIGSIFSLNSQSKAKLVRLFFIKASPVNITELEQPSNAFKSSVEEQGLSPEHYQQALNRVQQEAQHFGWQSSKELTSNPNITENSNASQEKESLLEESSEADFTEDPFEDDNDSFDEDEDEDSVFAIDENDNLEIDEETE